MLKLYLKKYVYTSLYSLYEGTELSLINLAFSYEVIDLTDMLSTFVLSRKVATNLFDCIYGFTGSTIMQSCMKIPLATKLCVLQSLLIICFANDKNSSKPRDRVSSFDQILTTWGVFNENC